MNRYPVSEQTDLVFRALGNEKRREIVYSLAFRPAAINKLADTFDLTLPAIHKHMKILEEAELVRRQKVGRTNIIALNPQSLALAKDWISQFNLQWGNQKESLDNYFPTT